MKIDIKTIFSSPFIGGGGLVIAILSLIWAVYATIASFDEMDAQKKRDEIEKIPQIYVSYLSNYRFLMSGHIDNAKTSKDGFKSQIKIENISGKDLSDVNINVLYSFNEDLVMYPYSGTPSAAIIPGIHVPILRSNTAISFDLIDALRKNFFEFYSIMNVPSSYLNAEVKRVDSLLRNQANEYYYSGFMMEESGAPSINKNTLTPRAVFLKVVIRYSFGGIEYTHLLKGALGFALPKKKGDFGVYFDGFNKPIYSKVKHNNIISYYPFEFYVYNGNDYFSDAAQKENFYFYAFEAKTEKGHKSLLMWQRLNIVADDNQAMLTRP